MEHADKLVERIIFDQDRAMGVRYVHKGQDEVARCSREIILAGGAVIDSQGRATFRDFYGNKDVLAIFPASEIEVLGVSPGLDRKSTRLNSSHMSESRMPSSA